jgi:hypothetical protein
MLSLVCTSFAGHTLRISFPAFNSQLSVSACLQELGVLSQVLHEPRLSKCIDRDTQPLPQLVLSTNERGGFIARKWVTLSIDQAIHGP